MIKTTTVSIVTILLATTIFAFMAPANATSGSQPLGVTGVAWFGQNSTQQAVPGMNEIPLFVSFETTATLQNLTVWENLSAYSPGIFNYSYVMGANANVNNIYNFGYIPAGTALVVEQTVNISSRAPNGIYLENLSYSYGNTTQTFYGNVSFQLPLQGTVNIQSSGSLFGTSASPIIGTPGMNNIPLTVILENTGNSPVSNVSIKYTPSGNLSGKTQNTVISAFEPFGVVPLTFTVSINGNSEVDQAYGQNLTVSYLGSTHKVSFSVPITGYSNLSLVSFYTNPPVIYQGQKYISLTLVAVNSGNSFATNVNVSVRSGQFSVLTNSYNLPVFPSGTIQNFTFLLNAHNYTGEASIEANLAGSTLVLPVYLHSYGSYKITQDIPALHTGATSQPLSFNITNTGNVTLYDFTLYYLSPSVVSIHVPSSNPLASLTSGNVTFSSISPGQTVTATYLVDTSSSAAFSTYSAQLAISWRTNQSAGAFHKTYNFNQTVAPTGIQNLKGMFTFTPLNIAVLVVILALIIGLVAVARRGRKARKKAEKSNSKNEPPSQNTGSYGNDSKQR